MLRVQCEGRVQLRKLWVMPLLTRIYVVGILIRGLRLRDSRQSPKPETLIRAVLQGKSGLIIRMPRTFL